jgi:sialate O-acetylesterase
VKGENTIELADVLVGEVWVASGQSNMKWPLRRTADADIEALRAHLPRMRLFTVPQVTTQDWAANPVCNLYGGSGQPASPFRTDDWPGITVGQH